MSDAPTVIVHIDETGWASYLIHGEARLLIVDERTPNDRVYQYDARSTADEIAAVIGDSRIGTTADDHLNARAHAAVAEMQGRPRLTLVEDDHD